MAVLVSGKIKDISLQYILLILLSNICSCLALLLGDVSLLVLVTTSLAVAFSWPCCSTTAKGSDISAPLLDGTKMAKNRNPPRLIEGGGRGYDQN